MIPQNSQISDFNNTMTSKTYFVDWNNGTITSMCDGEDALKQAIYKILNTEKFQNVIYSHNYGCQLIELFGKSSERVCMDLKNNISEALLQDDRISKVDGFEFKINKNTVTVSFYVYSNNTNIFFVKEVSF